MAAEFAIRWTRAGEKIGIIVEGKEYRFLTYDQAQQCCRDLAQVNNPAWKDGKFETFMIGIRT